MMHLSLVRIARLTILFYDFIQSTIKWPIFFALRMNVMCKLDFHKSPLSQSWLKWLCYRIDRSKRPTSQPTDRPTLLSILSTIHLSIKLLCIFFSCYALLSVDYMTTTIAAQIKRKISTATKWDSNWKVKLHTWLQNFRAQQKKKDRPELHNLISKLCAIIHLFMIFMGEAHFLLRLAMQKERRAPRAPRFLICSDENF